MRLLALVWAVTTVVVAAGCAAPVPDAKRNDTALLPLDPAAAALCDPARPAVAHRASGGAPEWSDPLPIPCLTRTGFNGGESSIGVSPKTGHVFYFPATIATGQARGVARSDDEGATWTRLLPNVNSEATPTHETSLDPFAYLDPATNRLFVDDLTGPAKCSLLSFSDDEGKTWSHSVAGCTQFDHTTIFAGKPVTSTTRGYPNVVYHCAYQTGATSLAGFGASCEKSLDGGTTWVATGAPITTPTMGTGNNGEPLCNAALGHGATGPDGAVYVPHGLCGAPTFAISHDEGMSWTNVKVSALGMPFSGDNYAHDAAVGVDPAGNVYFGWTAKDRMPHLTISRDGGKTWSSATSLAAPGVSEVGNFEMVVGGVGKLAFVYMGSTNSPGGPFPDRPCMEAPTTCFQGVRERDYSNVSWDGFMGMTVDALSMDPTIVSATVNPHSDPLIRGTCGSSGRCQEQGDFMDIRLGPDGTPWAALVDGCTEKCASDPKGIDNVQKGIVGRLVGGPSLL